MTRSGWICFALAVGLLGSGCSSQHTTKLRVSSMKFLEGVSVAVPVDGSGALRFGNGVGGSVRVDNQGTASITITRIEPRGDPGLGIRYVGHSTCRNGCPGAETYTQDAVQMLTKTVDGVYPITIPPGGGGIWLIFRIESISKGASGDLLRRCELGFSSALITLADGSEAIVKAPGYVVAVRPDSKQCIAKQTSGT